MPEALETQVLISQDDAPPPAAGGGGGIMGQIPILLVILGVFYFIVIRPQQKARKELEELQSTLKKGDEVQTEGGFVGKVWEVQGDLVVLDLGDKARVRIKKDSVQGKYVPPAAEGSDS